MKSKLNQSGQGTVEMVFLIPLFVILAAGAIFISYICWQGIKVQEAANVAARIAGQEMVGGGINNRARLEDNGYLTDVGGTSLSDKDPSEECDDKGSPEAVSACYREFSEKIADKKGLKDDPNYGVDSEGNGGVYWKYRSLVNSLFTPGEQKRLLVPLPKNRGTVSEVKVTRVMQPPTVFGWKPQPITIEGKAYGGEDTYIYSLPRFGRTSDSGQAGKNTFWQQQLNKLKDDLRGDQTGQ